MKSNSDSFFEDFVSEYAGILARKVPGISEDQAWAMAKEAADAMRKYFVGEKLYFPKCPSLQDRDREISRRFNGENAHEICQEYRISNRRLYQIVQAVAAEQKRKEPSIDDC